MVPSETMKQWRWWRGEKKIKNICTKCGKHKRRKGGRWCNKCHAEYIKKWRQTDKGKQAMIKQIENLKNNKNQYKAKMEVFKAVRSGRLPKVKTLKCVDCGRQAQGYDHRDYLKPLNVDPVCRICNKERGEGRNKI